MVRIKKKCRYTNTLDVDDVYHISLNLVQNFWRSSLDKIYNFWKMGTTHKQINVVKFEYNYKQILCHKIEYNYKHYSFNFSVIAMVFIRTTSFIGKKFITQTH
jgi:hypothetical protein